jgi:GNAT superfamily N-acetyltransferase
METTRPAHEADRAACHTLLTQALAGARDRRGGMTLVGQATPDELMARWLPAGVGSPEAAVEAEAAVYVGEFHGALVGLAAATTFTRPGATALSGRIECCYVEEAARGVGVGSALMASLVDWCTELGCLDIDAPALPGDRLSKQRYEAAGFTARLLVLNRPLN